MVDPHQKKTNYLFSPKEFINYGSTNIGNSEILEEQVITLNHPLDTESLEAKTSSVMNAKSQVTTKATAPNFKKKSLKKSLSKKRRKV